MKLGRTVSGFQAGLIMILLLVVAPLPAAGQQTQASSRQNSWEAKFSTLPLLPPEQLNLLADSPRERALPLTMDRADVRKRLWPYFLVGALAGGVAGYLYNSEIARTPSDEDWGVGAIVWPLNGAALGGLVGLGIGYIVERR